jgi:hypothetical protein
MYKWNPLLYSLRTPSRTAWAQWGGLNDLYEEIMVAAAPIVDLLDRGNGCFGLYGILDGLYHLAWESLWDARPELEKRLSRRFPVTLEGDNERCGCCR